MQRTSQTTNILIGGAPDSWDSEFYSFWQRERERKTIYIYVYYTHYITIGNGITTDQGTTLTTLEKPINRGTVLTFMAQRWEPINPGAFFSSMFSIFRYTKCRFLDFAFGPEGPHDGWFISCSKSAGIHCDTWELDPSAH